MPYGKDKIEINERKDRWIEISKLDKHIDSKL